MIKSLKRIASGVVAIAAALASPVLAGPYVNVENNSAYSDGFSGAVTDLHVGYEGGERPLQLLCTRRFCIGG